MRVAWAVLCLAVFAAAGEPAEPGALRVIRKDGETLDLGDTKFRGAPDDADPDTYQGIGLLIENCKNVTVRGGTFSGFRCAILVRGCTNVVLEGINVSGNFRQRLRSTPEREFSGDWLWPHKNDAQEWRKNYGAGICIEKSTKCTVRRCVGRQQQNGVLLDRATECRVYDCDMSFNSGWGLALWRSSKNVVSHNNFDWCVRGYSHGVYDRGQDSAGILVFEQCRDNLFAYNSATHGGDGFFLYAGHETLKRTGVGGCNGNRLLNNDFSHAVANAIEATFSGGNWFEGNRCDDSNYGIWAGYSYDTVILGNTFEGNSIAGIGIEHGENNGIFANTFANNPRAIWLWWDNDKDLLASVFAQKRSCRSTGYRIFENSFSTDQVALFLQRTNHVLIAENDFDAVPTVLKTTGNCFPIRGELQGVRSVIPEATGAEVPGQRKPFLPADHPRGRRFIMVNEWGPLDPRKPEVYPRRVVGADTCRFHVVGAGATEDALRVDGLPAGVTMRRTERGFELACAVDGLTPYTATVVLNRQRFPIRGMFVNATWSVSFWEGVADPRKDTETFARKPDRTETVRRLHYQWGHKGDRFATRATTRMKLPAGRYEIRTLSDDGVRVQVDGKVVQEDWTHHGPTEHKTVLELGAGEHTFVVEHFELTGYAVLTFDIRPLPARRVALDYTGKYKDDPRLAAVLATLPGLRAAAVQRIGDVLGENVADTFRVRIEDSGADQSGRWAEVRTERVDGEARPVLILRAEHLVLDTHDLGKTLTHELYHCLQRDRLGESKHLASPDWVREGAALYVAGQAADRSRALAAFVGSDTRVQDPLARLVNGLDGRHSLIDYAEDVSAFLSVEARHGRAKAVALLHALLTDVDTAVQKTLGETDDEFAGHAAAHARRLLRPLIEEGRESILRTKRKLAAKEYDAALAALKPAGVYVSTGAYLRALALFRLERHGEALLALSDPGIRRTTLVSNAVLLKLRILKATGAEKFAEEARRARLDLEPFRVYRSVLKLLDD